jgi:hypothetical protein
MIDSKWLNDANGRWPFEATGRHRRFALFVAIRFTRVKNQTVTPSHHLCYGAHVLLDYLRHR